MTSLRDLPKPDAVQRSTAWGLSFFATPHAIHLPFDVDTCIYAPILM